MMPPGCSSPEASAASIIRVAMRSFTDPPGLRYSTFASTIGPSSPCPSGASSVRLSRSRGVWPIRSRSESTYCTHPTYAHMLDRTKGRAGPLRT